jgi:hypothetical protein
MRWKHPGLPQIPPSERPPPIEDGRQEGVATAGSPTPAEAEASLPSSVEEPAEAAQPIPEKAMGQTNDEISKALESIQERLGRIEARAVPVEKLTGAVQEAIQHRVSDARQAQVGQVLQEIEARVSGLEAKLTTPDPRLTEIAGMVDTIKGLCALHPELCAHLEAHRPPPTPSPPPGPVSNEQAHEALVGALNEAGQKVLGRLPAWSDFLDLCPDGDCAKRLLEVIGKRPALLDALASQEGVAEALIEALKKAGKLVVEPAPELVEAVSGGKRGWFGGISGRE